MKKIDLRTCKPGDILIGKNGYRLEYISPTPWEDHIYADHVVKFIRDPEGMPCGKDCYGTRTHDGFVMKNPKVRKAFDIDIINIIRFNHD